MSQDARRNRVVVEDEIDDAQAQNQLPLELLEKAQKDMRDKLDDQHPVNKTVISIGILVILMWYLS